MSNPKQNHAPTGRGPGFVDADDMWDIASTADGDD
jgi:hypothetical protein